MLLRRLARELEGEAQDAVDADARQDRLLHDELALGAGEHAAADGGVLALVVLAHDPEVDVAGLAAGERGRHAGHQPHRPQVHVLVELAAERDEQAPERDVVGDFAGQPTAPKKIASWPPICAFQSSGIMRPCLA